MPREIVRFIDDPACVDEARAWVERAVATLSEEAYLSSADEAAVENALYLLREMRVLLDGEGSASVEAFLKKARAAVPLVTRVVRDRGRVWFLAAEPLDALLQAGVAAAQGRGSAGAVLARLPEAVRYVAKRHQEMAASEVPWDVRERAGRGFELVTEGLEGLAAGREMEKALARVRAGGEMIEALERILSGRPRVGVPVGGEVLARLVEAPGDQVLAAEVLVDVLPRLREVYAEACEGLPLRLEVREEVLGEVGAALDGLEGGLASGSSSGVDEAVRRVERAFASLRNGVVRAERVGSARYAALARLVSDLWFGLVPRVTFLETFNAMVADDGAPEIEAAARHLEVYFETGERLHVQAALEWVMGAGARPWLEGEEGSLVLPEEVDAGGDAQL